MQLTDHGNPRTPLLNDPAKRSLIYQTGVLIGVALLAYYLVTNTLANLERQAIATGFGFLESVSILISAFKDTSLVVIIALYDLLKTTKSVLADPNWMGFSAEAYIFLALIYFLCCYFMSNYSRRLERELDRNL